MSNCVKHQGSPLGTEEVVVRVVDNEPGNAERLSRSSSATRRRQHNPYAPGQASSHSSRNHSENPSPVIPFRVAQRIATDGSSSSQNLAHAASNPLRQRFSSQGPMAIGGMKRDSATGDDFAFNLNSSPLMDAREVVHSTGRRDTDPLLAASSDSGTFDKASGVEYHPLPPSLLIAPSAAAAGFVNVPLLAAPADRSPVSLLPPALVVQANQSAPANHNQPSPLAITPTTLPNQTGGGRGAQRGRSGRGQGGAIPSPVNDPAVPISVTPQKLLETLKAAFEQAGWPLNMESFTNKLSKGRDGDEAALPQQQTEEVEDPQAEAVPSVDVFCPSGWQFSLFDSDIRQHFYVDSAQVIITAGAIKYVDYFNRFGHQTRFRFQLCRRFRAARCKSGNECQYVHCRELPRPTNVHVNENAATSNPATSVTLQMILGGINNLQYPTLPHGTIFNVFPPNNATNTSQLISSHQILETIGALSVYQVLSQQQGATSGQPVPTRQRMVSFPGTHQQLAITTPMTPPPTPHGLKPRHCAHFQFKRMCHLGYDCNFIHSLVPFIQGVSYIKDTPASPTSTHFANHPSGTNQLPYMLQRQNSQPMGGNGGSGSPQQYIGHSIAHRAPVDTYPQNNNLLALHQQRQAPFVMRPDAPSSARYSPTGSAHIAYPQPPNQASSQHLQHQHPHRQQIYAPPSQYQPLPSQHPPQQLHPQHPQHQQAYYRNNEDYAPQQGGGAHPHMHHNNNTFGQPPGQGPYSYSIYNHPTSNVQGVGSAPANGGLYVENNGYQNSNGRYSTTMNY